MWHFTIHTDPRLILSDSYFDFLGDFSERHVFFSPSLIRSWLETYLPIRELELFFISGENNAKNKVFLPLALWHRNWKNAFQKLLIPIGYSDFDYHDPIFLHKPSDNDVVMFWDELQSQLSSCCRYDKWVLDGLHENHSPKQFSVFGSEKCFFIPLAEYDSFDAFYRNLPHSLIKKNNRRTRNLEKIGNIELKIFESDDLPSALTEMDAMLLHHAKRWPNAYKAPRFHEKLVTHGLRDKTVLFSCLQVNEKSIAWRLSFQYRKILHLYLQASDSEFRDFSPGTILLLHLLDYAMKNRFLCSDHLRGSESYKQDWTSHYRTVYDWVKESSDFSSRFRNNLVKWKNRWTPRARF